MKKTIFGLCLTVIMIAIMPVLGWTGAVTNPTAGESLTMGTDYNIQWTPTAGTTNVVIYYSLDNGVTWRYVTGPTADDGAYVWTVPFIASTTCKLVVIDADGYPGGVPSASFSIVDDGTSRLIVTSPNGTEKWVVGKAYDITWLSTGTTGDVMIEYSTNSGTDWNTVIATTDNDGSYSWTVPAGVSEQCLVRVSEETDSLPIDQSDAAFSIISASTQALNLTYPNGGEALNGGDNAVISWNSNGSIYNIRLEYSTNNGSTWKFIAMAGNTGTYSWKVPNTPSTQCKVRISDGQDNNPIDSSYAAFSIMPKPGATDKLTVTSPNGGELITGGVTYNVTWTSVGAIGNVKIEYTTNNGGAWTTASASTSNTGTYAWVVPPTPATQCKVRVTRVEETSISDSSDSVFKIGDPVPSIWLFSPIGGEEWEVGTVQDITWQSYGVVGNVKIQYSTNNKSTWVTLTSSTVNDGSYSWTIPNKLSTTCFVKVSEASDDSPTNTSAQAFSIISPVVDPKISLNRTELFFGSVKSSTDGTTPSQTIIVNNGGGRVLTWSATTTVNWLRLSGAIGQQTGTVTASVSSLGMAPGTYTGSIIFTANDASNSPLSIPVTFIVYPALLDGPPIGNFDGPADGSTVMSSVPVTGWALDDIGIWKVVIKRDAVAGEDTTLVDVGDAVLVDGARPDVEQAYPGYPMNYKAGWGYMLLTNMLPNGGNGPFKLHAYALDYTGHQVYLGSKLIYCDNAHAVKPFGAIDTPTQGGTASGTNYRNQGWVLTPVPNMIPTNGSTIEVFINGVSIGHTHYNVYRSDIATLFPGYANSDGALAYFDFDTTDYPGGVYTIQWTARDTGGNTDGIGSRYFVIQQSAGDSSKDQNAVHSMMRGNEPLEERLVFPVSMVEMLRENNDEPVRMRTGYGDGVYATELLADDSGMMQVTIPETERLVLEFGKLSGGRLVGYQQVGDQLRRLPIGSSLDTKRGVFYWQPGAGFIGDYLLVFVSTDTDGNVSKRTVQVSIKSKFGK